MLINMCNKKEISLGNKNFNVFCVHFNVCNRKIFVSVYVGYDFNDFINGFKNKGIIKGKGIKVLLS